MSTPRVAHAARPDDENRDRAALGAADWPFAYQAASLAGRAVVALAGGLAVGRIERAGRLPDGRYRPSAVHLASAAAARTARLRAWAAGPVAMELFCGAARDGYDGWACAEAFDDSVDRGHVDPDDGEEFQDGAWERARRAARATLGRAGPRRATLAIAARLLEPDAAVLSGVEIGRLYAEALRRAGVDA